MKSHNIQLGVEALILDKRGKLIRAYEEVKDNEEAKVTLKQMDINGNVKRYEEKYSKSFVSNFGRALNWAFMAIDNSTSGATTDKIIAAITGGATHLAGATHIMKLIEGALTSPTQTAYGIWVGDKDNKSGLSLTTEAGIAGYERHDDYMLRTLILADGGSPDTDLEYRATSVVISGNTLTITRRFQNDGSGTITVDEIGLVGQSGSDEFLIARDTFDGASAYELAATDILVVQYSYEISNISGFTKNYLRMLDSLFRAGNANYDPRDILGSYYTVNFSSARTQTDLNAGAAADTHGIVIGGYVESGAYTDPEIPTPTTDDYKLYTPKLLTSQIAYSAMSSLDLVQNTEIPQDTNFGMSRDFENSGLYPVRVWETANYMKEAAAGHYFMITRSVFSSSILVNPGEILRLNKRLYFSL